VKVYDGEVLVVAGDALLNAKAHLVAVEGFWGGFLTMRSTAGAELVMEAQHNQRFLTFDTRNPHAFVPRRTNAESPVIRITGLGLVPGQVKHGVAREAAGKVMGTTE
jgi:hypothetical protein